jgi:hypothetical protein
MTSGFTGGHEFDPSQSIRIDAMLRMRHRGLWFGINRLKPGGYTGSLSPSGGAGTSKALTTPHSSA